MEVEIYMDFVLGMYFILTVINSFSIAILLGRATVEDADK